MVLETKTKLQGTLALTVTVSLAVSLVGCLHLTLSTYGTKFQIKFRQLYLRSLLRTLREFLILTLVVHTNFVKKHMYLLNAVFTVMYNANHIPRSRVRPTPRITTSSGKLKWKSAGYCRLQQINQRTFFRTIIPLKFSPSLLVAPRYDRQINFILHRIQTFQSTYCKSGGGRRFPERPRLNTNRRFMTV